MFSIFLVQPGCTTSPLKPWAPHVTEEVRAKIRTIGVAVVEEIPRVTIEGISSSDTAGEARRTAGQWVDKWVMWMSEVAKGRDFPVTTTLGAMLVLTPVVWGAGAVAGAIEAPPSGKVLPVHGVLQVEDLIQRLQRHVITHVTERTDISVPTLLKTANDSLGDRETVSASGVSQLDAILRILVLSIDLRGASDIDPLLALHLDVQATLVAPSAATPLYTHSFQYVTGALRLTEWTADDAQVFRETVDLSLVRLAELMVEDLFMTHPFVHEHLTVRHGS